MLVVFLSIFVANTKIIWAYNFITPLNSWKFPGKHLTRENYTKIALYKFKELIS